MAERRDAKLLQVLSREVRQDPSRLSHSRGIPPRTLSRPRLRSQTTTSMTAPQTQGCSASSCGPGKVSRRPEAPWTGGFSVNQRPIKTVPSSPLT